MKKIIKHLSVNIIINAPEKVIFDEVTNWARQEKWVYLTKVRGLGNDANALGGRLEAFTGIGRIGFVDTMTITKWENNKLCEVTHTGNIVKGRGVFEVSVKDSLNFFTWDEYVELPFGFIGILGWIFIKPVAKLGLWLSLKKLKKQIETSTK